MQTKAFSLAMGALLLSADAASAAKVTENLNVRSGPGMSYSVIAVYAASPAAGVVAPGYSYTYAWSPYGNWAPYVGYGGWPYNRYHWYR
jgi:uncharacterized protein YraI